MRWSTFLVGASLLMLLGCAPHTRDTRRNPFPKQAPRRWLVDVHSLAQTRCWGGGIGGCSLSGKAEGGIP